MTPPAIKVDGLWKRYHKRFGASTLWSFFGRHERTDDEFWALKDVSFEVQPGECLGIIGPNGSGKSTLLKILSRITNPTRGRVEVRGRVASMLEVGTGFHSELTGRENVFLSGAILGMSQAEIRRRFDEIVAFSGVEEFIDVPVKRYSSGMYVRLAFAVAAHIETDILIVDEVLAVGDAEFQRKCMGRMGEAGKQGRTVLFVSHNMGAVQNLCGRGLLLDHGAVCFLGATPNVIESYVERCAAGRPGPEEERVVKPGRVGYTRWGVADSAASGAYSTYAGDPCKLVFRLVSRRTLPHANFGLVMTNGAGVIVWSARSLDYGGLSVGLEEGEYEVRFSTPSLPLQQGEYHLHVSINTPEDGTVDSWHAQPALRVLARRDSGMPAQFRGVLDVPGEFGIERTGDPR